MDPKMSMKGPSALVGILKFPFFKHNRRVKFNLTPEQELKSWEEPAGPNYRKAQKVEKRLRRIARKVEASSKKLEGITLVCEGEVVDERIAHEKLDLNCNEVITSTLDKEHGDNVGMVAAGEGNRTNELGLMTEKVGKTVTGNQLFSGKDATAREVEGAMGWHCQVRCTARIVILDSSRLQDLRKRPKFVS